MVAVQDQVPNLAALQVSGNDHEHLLPVCLQDYAEESDLLQNMAF